MRRHIARCGVYVGLQSTLLLFWWLSILCVTNASQPCPKDTHLQIYPRGLVKLDYDNPLVVYCAVTTDNFTADDIEFTGVGMWPPSEKVNTTTWRLDKNPSITDLGEFTQYCKNKKTNKYCFSSVYVSSSPDNVSFFSCTSYNLEELSCSWSAYDSLVTATKYTLAFVVNGNRTELCVARELKKFSYVCSWNVNSSQNYKPQSNTFNLILSSTNVLGVNEENFTIDHYSVVKPAPVKDLKILGVGSHSVQLQWKIPKNIIELLPVGIQHKIEYRVSNVNRASSRFLSVNTSSLPPKNSTYTISLSELPHAHMQYEVRICIRPVTATREEYWSNYSSVFCYVGGFRRNKVNESSDDGWDQSSTELPLVVTSTPPVRALPDLNSTTPALVAENHEGSFANSGSSSINCEHHLSEAMTFFNRRYNFYMFLLVFFYIIVIKQ